MKKTIIALAALTAFAGIASAQSNVTLYGVVDIGLERTNISPGAKATRLSSGIQSGSRFGFKGNEDLGGGLSASFQLESGFDASTGGAGAGLNFGRQSWVGLNGGFGSVKAGRQYIPLFLAQDTIDPFGTGLSGDGSGMAAVFRHYGVRMNNTLNYSTPAMGGFSGEAAYSLGEVAGSTSIGSQYGMSGTYSGGPLTLVGAFHHQNQASGAGVATGKSRTFLLGGVYDLKALAVHAAFADNRDEDAAGLTAGRSRDAMIGVSAPFGPVSLMASYIRHDDRFVANADAGYWQLGATYLLSKRTNFYTSYSTIRNDAGGATGSGVAGADISWLNVGIRHKF